MRILACLFSAIVITNTALCQTDPSASTPTYQPISGEERLKWVAQTTVGPASLAGGVISAGFGTWINRPREYGTHWEGFGDRYGMRLTGIAVGQSMEAGLGALWGEDPRYRPLIEQPFKTRLGHAVKMAFLAEKRDGSLGPAYARYIAVPGNNFLSNTWRADSEATLSNAAVRTGLGFAGRICSNLFAEFWPSLAQRFSHKPSTPAPSSTDNRK